MKKSRFTDSHILPILKQAENGVPVPELCREHGMSSALFYKWRTKYGGWTGLADIDKGGDVPIVIQHGVHLYPSLVPAERCPRKDGQTKADGSGIHAVQLALETEFVARA